MHGEVEPGSDRHREQVDNQKLRHRESGHGHRTGERGCCGQRRREGLLEQQLDVLDVAQDFGLYDSRARAGVEPDGEALESGGEAVAEPGTERAAASTTVIDSVRGRLTAACGVTSVRPCAGM